MPSPVPLLLMMLAATPASAGSIERIATASEPARPTGSIVTLDCLSCPPVERRRPSMTAPFELAPGQQILSLQERNGKPVLLRTEAWMGGSPVTFVSLNPVWIDREEQAIVARARPASPMDPAAPSDPLDTGTTAAVPAPPTQAAPRLPSAAPAPLPDFSGVALRPAL
ncbi:hypothetical protein J2858_000704 [Neorhizobium galegae]|uniref:plant virulence effector HPE1-like domain-containing protein n=1 Tax=Neorhizobium galegae TaxID=399 RepID=UPI001AE3AEA3|nr:plant virulence effector HPE1-like domain-containing protein [Neorhizobium galegae]MBP2547811.1 hypothetical protein [Neorhizobium galegae]